ncbi:gp21 [Burkholderia phage Bcep1]|uniref:Gp21 n=1 Tax=Burkholderia phage Bcep1 TaxID=2883943 RepID=Q6UJ11_9CAUD|nr:exonuclease [Burkholderia phage Bcep1]AAQ73367.1 gp21 [Burkholderia phage Bcep1]
MLRLRDLQHQGQVMSNPGVVEHSTLSISGRERWRNCPASVTLSKGMPDNSSPAAAEGTCAHTVGEFYVRQHFDLPGAAPRGTEAPLQAVPEGLDLKGKTVEEWNDDLRRHGKAYRDFIISLIPPGVEAFVSLEQRVAAKTIDGRLFGTADCLIWCPGARVLIVVDYKYGFMVVDVGTAEKPNAQLAAYAVAALDSCTLQANGVMLAVFQPRRNIGEPGHKVYLSAEHVAAEQQRMREEVVRVDKATASPDLFIVAGDHCRYCKAKPACPRMQDALQIAFDVNAGRRSILDMPEDDLIALYSARSGVKSLWEDVEQRIELLAQRGHDALTIKTSPGRRMWRNAKAAALTLLALDRTDLLQPVALSEAIAHIPEALHDDLIGKSRDSQSIVVKTPAAPGAVADTFAKYAKSVDTTQDKA